METEDNRIKAAIRRALAQQGLVFPTEIEDIDKASEAIDEENIELPAHLTGDDFTAAILRGDPPPQSVTPPTPGSSADAPLFALAARKGKEITPEIAEKMKKDREANEQNPKS